MLVYEVEFLKASGEKRKMKFVKIKDMPEEFVKRQLSGKNQKRTLTEGMELVWDLEKGGFRTINWKSLLGVPKVTDENAGF
jgi:hypothetical protein